MFNSDEEYYRAMRDLTDGQNGRFTTGSVHNMQGLSSYELSHKPNATTQPRGESRSISYGSGSSDGLDWLTFPFILALLIGGGIAAEALYDWIGNWWVVGIIGAVALVLFGMLYNFLQTPLGIRIKEFVVGISFLSLIGYLIYSAFQWTGIAIAVGAIGALIALGYLFKGIGILLTKIGEAFDRFFTENKTGRFIARWTRRLVAAAIAIAISYGGYMAWVTFQASA